MSWFLNKPVKSKQRSRNVMLRKVGSAHRHTFTLPSAGASVTIFTGRASQDARHFARLGQISHGRTVRRVAAHVWAMRKGAPAWMRPFP